MSVQTNNIKVISAICILAMTAMTALPGASAINSECALHDTDWQQDALIIAQNMDVSALDCDAEDWGHAAEQLALYHAALARGTATVPAIEAEFSYDLQLNAQTGTGNSWGQAHAIAEPENGGSNVYAFVAGTDNCSFFISVGESALPAPGPAQGTGYFQDCNAAGGGGGGMPLTASASYPVQSAHWDFDMPRISQTSTDPVRPTMTCMSCLVISDVFYLSQPALSTGFTLSSPLDLHLVLPKTMGTVIMRDFDHKPAQNIHVAYNRAQTSGNVQVTCVEVTGAINVPGCAAFTVLSEIASYDAQYAQVETGRNPVFGLCADGYVTARVGGTGLYKFPLPSMPCVA